MYRFWLFEWFNHQVNIVSLIKNLLSEKFSDHIYRVAVDRDNEKVVLIFRNKVVILRICIVDFISIFKYVDVYSTIRGPNGFNIIRNRELYYVDQLEITNPRCFDILYARCNDVMVESENGLLFAWRGDYV